MVAARTSRIGWTIPLLIVIDLFGSGARAEYGGGTGEPNDPYLIYTAEQMNEIGTRPHDWGKHFKLMADIDLSPFDGRDGRPQFNVIASYTGDADWNVQGAPFTGVFDGDGHTISNFVYTSSRRVYIGLFGNVDHGEIRNLGLTGVTIEAAGGSYVGGLAGWNAGRITQCFCSGTVSGRESVGGLTGGNEGAVTQCYSTCAVSGASSTGGLIGWDYYGVVTQCYSAGAVSASGPLVGGLVGEYYSEASYDPAWGVITNCFWDIQTSGRTASEGGIGLTTAQMHDESTWLDAGWDLVGESGNGTAETWQMPEGGGYPVLAIFAGYTPPQLKGSGTPDDPYLISIAAELGAICHYPRDACYQLIAAIDLACIRWHMPVVPLFAGTFDGNDLTISHLTVVGGGNSGLFGVLDPGATIKNLGVVDANVGGPTRSAGILAAHSSAAVTCCYTTGMVQSLGDAGGLAALNGGDIAQCYSAAVVSGGTGFVGGLVGGNWGDVTCCYSSGPVIDGHYIGGLMAANSGSVTASFWDIQTSGQTWSAGGEGCTTAKMHAADTFLSASWDFVGETANGTADFWRILEGQDYPRLSWQSTEQP